ncbi:hypothetical protein ACJX0J_013645, partial [Zea mays]
LFVWKLLSCREYIIRFNVSFREVMVTKHVSISCFWLCELNGRYPTLDLR